MNNLAAILDAVCRNLNVELRAQIYWDDDFLSYSLIKSSGGLSLPWNSTVPLNLFTITGPFPARRYWEIPVSRNFFEL
jgi:hypothetical protein